MAATLRSPDRLLALECLDRVGLMDLAMRRADTLSGGQQQRVAIEALKCQQAIGAIEASQPSTPGRHVAQAPSKNIFKRRQPVHQVELLKNDCHLSQAPRHHGGHLAHSDPNGTLIGGEQAGYATEQSRLAGAARPKYGDKFMPGGGEVDVFNCLPPVKRFAEPAHGELHLARRTRQVGILARSRRGYVGLTAHSSYEPFAQPP